MPLQAGNNGVLSNTQHAENTGGPALFRQQREAVFNGFAGAAVETRLAIQVDPAFLTGTDAKDAFQGFRTTGGIQTCQAQHFASLCFERYIPQLIVHTGDIFHLQIYIAGGIGLGRELIGQFTANHQPDNVRHFQILCPLGSYPLAVTHNGNVVGDPLDLRHLVGDVDDADAPVAEQIDDLKQLLTAFRRGQVR